MDFNSMDFKKILSDVVSECLTGAIKDVKSELLKLDNNISSEIFGNSQAITIMNNELSHVKTQLQENTINIKDSMETIRDLKNITIGVDGQNGLRSRIIKLEEITKCHGEDYEEAQDEIKKEINQLKQWRAQIIGISIGLWLIGSIALGTIINFKINSLLQDEKSKQTKYEEVYDKKK